MDITPATNGEAPDSPIPRRKKEVKEVPQSNGNATNGSSAPTSSAPVNGGSAPKRSATEAFSNGDETPTAKKAKTQSNGADNDVIEIIDDGAILIDDD